MKTLRRIAGCVAFAALPALPIIARAAYFYGPEMLQGDAGGICIVASGAIAFIGLMIIGVWGLEAKG